VDDYHEFWHAHEVEIQNWQLYWSLNYVSITIMIVASSGALATPNNYCTNGNGSASSAATRSGSANPSTKKQGPLLTFNPIVEFFHVLQWNYQGIQIDKLRTLQKFQHKPHENLREVYTRMW